MVVQTYDDESLVSLVSLYCKPCSTRAHNETVKNLALFFCNRRPNYDGSTPGGVLIYFSVGDVPLNRVSISGFRLQDRVSFL